MRADENWPCLGQDAALANAPERSDAFFRVPKIIEEGAGEPSQGSPS
jgi:Asp-tRNA(Asn)/Glu-tRNA(Gln) amidotransferase C subunit